MKPRRATVFIHENKDICFQSFSKHFDRMGFPRYQDDTTTVICNRLTDNDISNFTCVNLHM